MDWLASRITAYRLILGLVLLAAMAGPLQARGKDVFQQHCDRATALYENGQYEESLQELQAAYAIRQLPRLLLNLGQVHRKLGHAKEALAYYEFYLRVEPRPKPEIKTELEGYIAQSRAMIEAAERVKKEFQANREQAEKEAAAELAAQQGTAQQPAEPSAPGPPSAEAPPPVAPSAPAPAATVAAQSAPVPPVLAPAPPPRTVTLVSSPPPPPRRVRRRWPLWVGIAAASVAVAGAVVAGAVIGTRPGEPVLPVENAR